MPIGSIILPEIHITNNHSKLDDIIENTQLKNEDQVIATSQSGISLYPDESPPIADEDNREGWLFKKTAAGTAKINWYFYDAGNTLTTLDDLSSLSVLLSVDTYLNTSSLPFFIVYTKMTASNNVGSWYKSKITYELSVGEKILPGEQIQAWSGIKPKQQSNKRLVEFNKKTVLGTGANTEELLTISVHTASYADINTKILISQVGFNLYTNDNIIERRLNLRF